ncbi:hypothetical protein HHK36_014779 [Tetracentron sinense]|uniref:Uncharacterized protein n=1 Tax=Tetracentron sinense TaxID=13715 RepID=A0A835DG50_TETSI|nr:hypothetical protein HHK36_014779 [Tetracentron sinense]
MWLQGKRGLCQGPQLKLKQHFYELFGGLTYSTPTEVNSPKSGESLRLLLGRASAQNPDRTQTLQQKVAMLLVKSNAIASPLERKLNENIPSISRMVVSTHRNINAGKNPTTAAIIMGLEENSIRAQQETEKVKKPMEITMKQYIAESRLPESAVL